jgi:hypothetical protein
MTDDANLKDATTRFPFINLEKAVARAKELYDADQQGREMPVATAFEVWEYSLKSSGGHQTVGALKMYGLIKDSGSMESRKIGLSDKALRYFKDEREEERQKLLQAFALTPKLMAVLWQDWNATPPADTIARSKLKLERGMSEQNARSFLGIYKENLDFAALKGDAKIPSMQFESVTEKTDRNNSVSHVKLGDFVQWTSNGVDQFNPPGKVIWISPDSTFLRVFGSPTGIPMNEILVVDAPANPPRKGAHVGASDINVYQTGGRLQITADVDAEGIQKLREVLQKYEEILKLLN